MKSNRELERDAIFEESLWSQLFCFYDIYHHADQEFKERVDLMSNDELEKFIEENKHSWGKGLDAGMNTSSDVVFRTIAQNSEWNELKDEENINQEETNT